MGKHIVAALHEQFPEARIHVLDKDVPRSLAPELARLIAQSYQVDITIAEDVNKVMEVIRPDVVVHTAGINPPLQERYLRRIEKLVRCVNVGGTNNVLTAARESGCNAFVYTSSCCVVTDDLHGSFANIDERWPVSHPSLMYGETKVAAEALVLAADGKDMATCVLRPSVIFGEGDPILGMWHFLLRYGMSSSTLLTSRSSRDTCMYRQGGNAFPPRRWLEPLGYRVRRQCRLRACLGGQKPAYNEVCARRGDGE